MVAQPLPSMCAAMASREEIVSTPVPPTPDTTVFQGIDRSGRLGSGREGRSVMGCADEAGCRGAPPTTDMKLGQKPLRQLKSVLQAFWSICRFRPRSVSLGITERQFDSALQSPQPSQTASLMTTRREALASFPFFCWRRFSVAQSCW